MLREALCIFCEATVNLKLTQSQLGFYWAADESVCVPTWNLQPQHPIAVFKGTLLVFLIPPCIIVWGGGVNRSNLKLWNYRGRLDLFATHPHSHILLRENSSAAWVALASFFISLFVLLSLSTSPCLLGRHRGYSEARWKGHYDLCILLLSCLLWSPEGELLTLLDHTNTKCRNNCNRVSIKSFFR